MAGQVGNISFDSLSVTAAAATAVCAAQAVAGAGNLTINGTQASAGVASLTGAVTAGQTVGRRVVGVSANAGDTTQTLTVTGTDRNGNVITDTIKLNGTTPVATSLDFLTVTKVAASAATAGNISVGTNNTASTPWRTINTAIKPVQIGFFAHLVSGSATFSVELTMDDPNYQSGIGAGFGSSMEPDSYSPPIAIADQSSGGGPITGKSADTVAILNFVAFAYRLTITAGQGTVSLQAIQAGMHE